jgi:PAS domain S-box-containing protein
MTVTVSDFAGMRKRQRILSDFGELALRSQDLDQVLHEACQLVSEALGTGRAKILEILHAEQQLFVRAGVGWDPGIVGSHRVPLDEHCSETFAIKAGDPVISRDIRHEDRFGIPPFMKAAGVVALVNVPILLPGGRPFGLLEVDATEPRDFDEDDAQFLRTYTAILGPVIDRLLLAPALRASEERFRLTVEEVLDYAIFITDPQDRITDWLPGAEAVFGWTAEEVVGQPAARIFTSEDRETHQDQWETRTAAKDGAAPDVRWHLRKDGRRVFIEGSTRALRDPDGTLRGFLKIGQDVTERLQAVERLQEERERFRILVESMPQLVWRSGDQGRWHWASPQWLEYTGQRQEESCGLGWLQAVHPDDREATMQAWQEAPAQGGLDAEYRLRRASDSSYRWHWTRSVLLHPGSDESQSGEQATEWLGTSTDIDDLKRLQGQQGILVAELQHRTRNMLGVVRSIASRSMAPSAGREDYQARLSALGRVQDFLSRSPDWEVSLLDLLEAELLAAGGGTSERVVVEGPPLQLSGDQVQTLALALHELATNAVKHGAIGQPNGRLTVTWRIEAGNGTSRVALDWRESGVVMSAARPKRRGFGSELIERAVPYQLKAETRLAFGPDGVHCRIVLPLSTFKEAQASV